MLDLSTNLPGVCFSKMSLQGPVAFQIQETIGSCDMWGPWYEAKDRYAKRSLLPSRGISWYLLFQNDKRTYRVDKEVKVCVWRFGALLWNYSFKYYPLLWFKSKMCPQRLMCLEGNWIMGMLHPSVNSSTDEFHSWILCKRWSLIRGGVNGIVYSCSLFFCFLSVSCSS